MKNKTEYNIYDIGIKDREYYFNIRHNYKI